MKNKIRELLNVQGVKASNVIKESGLSKSYFYDLLNCNSMPSLAIARKLSESMGVSVDDLFPNEEIREE